ncbi:retinol dehydrogenase 12-like [Corticium candelabrum]|uniref:retinol dehydrogenase 12-like n=1 Tax=Corticium candelabrum TaxID=121492 RepID=UPI002E253ACD|nr:retinol dehydrogenase 12-like [Corticium candelabrum]
MGARLSYPEVDLKGKVAVVTGGNTGIGYETAKALARMGAHVVIACRSQERAQQAIERIKLELSEAGEVNVEFVQLDLSSLQSARDFTDNFIAKGLPLHLLILNAGIAAVELGRTVDGHEKHFQINYLSHLLITLNLMSVIKSSGPDARIVNVSSYAATFGKFDPSNMDGSQRYSRMGFYGNSKLFQIMSMYFLQRRIAGCGVTISSLHPGAVDTEISRNFQDSTFWKTVTNVVKSVGVLRSPEKGAATTINAAVNPEFKDMEALYFENCKVTQPVRSARDEATQERLWEYSFNLIREYVDTGRLASVGIELPSIPDTENNHEATGSTGEQNLTTTED